MVAFGYKKSPCDKAVYELSHQNDIILLLSKPLAPVLFIGGTHKNFARRISSRPFLDRLNTLRHQLPELNTLIFLIGEDASLNWGQSIGVTVDETLRSLVDALPPIKLKHIAGPSSESLYLTSGLRDVAKTIDACEAHAEEPTAPISVLDFGCGAGRMMRFVSKLVDYHVVGCDVNADLVKWCTQNLSGIDSVLTGMTPPLPFADSHIDVIYSKSVFTHLPESLCRSWIAELARVTKRGGWIILTTNGIALKGVLKRSD